MNEQVILLDAVPIEKEQQETNGFIFGQLTSSSSFILGAAAFLMIIMFLVSGPLQVGLVVGLLSCLGLSFMVLKLKDKRPDMWNAILENEGTVDVLLSLAAIIMAVTGSVAGLVASAATGIFASAALRGSNIFIGKDENYGTFNVKNWFKETIISPLSNIKNRLDKKHSYQAA